MGNFDLNGRYTSQCNLLRNLVSKLRFESPRAIAAALRNVSAKLLCRDRKRVTSFARAFRWCPGNTTPRVRDECEGTQGRQAESLSRHIAGCTALRANIWRGENYTRVARSLGYLCGFRDSSTRTDISQDFSWFKDNTERPNFRHKRGYRL